MTEGVKVFLHNLGMGKYSEIFSAKGFDLETDIPYLTESDLKETLMVTCPEEREIILYSARRFRTSPEHFVYEWLRRNSLDHYFVSFIQSGLVTLEAVSKIELPNEELYDELEIELPGHRKRLERAVLSLHQEMQRRSVAEKPVTQGWWGKPRCLPQAKFDFLCVEGILFGRRDPKRRVKIDFMVDSGSDVSTVQESMLESLDLELVGPIYSCGIHGGNHTNLYRAQLQIGSEEMTVEVIASNYDSLGSRIVRHFRHVIDGNRHIWLKGNYRDPVPAVLPLKTPSTVKPLENKPHVLSIDNLNRSTASLMSPSHCQVKTSIPSLPSSQQPIADLNSNSASYCQSSQKSNNAGTVTNQINGHAETHKLPVHTAMSHKVVSLPEIGNKRARELSEEESSRMSESLSPKFMKLDHTIKDHLPNHLETSSSSSQSPSSMSEGQTLPTHYQGVLQTTTYQPPSACIPSNSNTTSTLHDSNNSPLRNTDDDIDHMDSDKIYAKYLSSRLSSSSTSLLSSTIPQSIDSNAYSSSTDFTKSSHLKAHPQFTPCEKSNNPTSHTDIIHIGNDDCDNDCDEDDKDDGVVHIGDKKDSASTNGTFGRNFFLGSNSNSVTISMLDLNAENFE